MLFYNQIKREFSPNSWKRGQLYFREQRVKNVRLDGNKVKARVFGSAEDGIFDTTLEMARGTIMKSGCSCTNHKVGENHCKHVAALSIWVVERGSLLRAGIGDEEDGVAEGEQYFVLHDIAGAMSDPRLKRVFKANSEVARSRYLIRAAEDSALLEGRDANHREYKLKLSLEEAEALEEYSKTEDEFREKPEAWIAEAVAFVRAVFNNKALASISVEAALRYEDPLSNSTLVEPLTHLTRGSELLSWKTPQGFTVKVPNDVVPMLGTLDSAKVVYQSATALESLAKILLNPNSDQIVFHHALKVTYDKQPLKLISVHIGEKSDKARKLSYEFKNDSIKLTSDELNVLSDLGRLSSQYVWAGDKLYRFETPLTMLSRFANRSGVIAGDLQKTAFTPDGYSYLDDDNQHPLHPLAAYRLSLELGVDAFTVDQDWSDFHEWKKNFERKKIPVLPNQDYGFELRDYQINGLNWIWSLYHRGLSALLGDDMGLGKTHQVLAFLTTIYKSRNKPELPTLVVAPTSVVAAWAQKLNKYDTNLKWNIFHGKGRVLPTSDVNIVLTTYGILQKEEALRSREWHCVILDEAQAIKNATTISSRASRILKSKFRIAMTGTPVENQSTDLWSIMEFLLPGYLGSLPRFKRLYGAGREAPDEHQAHALRRLVSPFLLRRTKQQVLKELPEKTEEIMTCEMTAVQKKAYKAYLNSAEADRVRENLTASTKVDYASVLALLTRLKQVCDHPKLPEYTGGKIKKITSLNPLDTGKWETFEELVSEALGSNLKVVIFTQYLGMMDVIGNYLEERNVHYTELRGDTPDRMKRMQEFSDNPECKVFLCSLLAGGLGIDLTAGSVCIHFDRWWNPAKENQATDRLHRIGQTRGVQVFKLQIPGTIEDRIASIIQSKTALSGALIEESPLGLKAFSRKELLELLTDLS